MRGLLKIWDLLEIWLGGILAIIATAIVVYAIALRFIWHNSPSWAIEVVIYLIIWASLIVSSYLIRVNGHIGADFVTHSLPPTLHRKVEILTTALSLCFTVVVVWFGLRDIYDLYEFGARSTSALRFPLWIAQGAVPIGALLMSARLVQRLVGLLRFSAGEGPWA